MDRPARRKDPLPAGCCHLTAKCCQVAAAFSPAFSPASLRAQPRPGRAQPIPGHPPASLSGQAQPVPCLCPGQSPALGRCLCTLRALLWLLLRVGYLYSPHPCVQFWGFSVAPAAFSPIWHSRQREDPWSGAGHGPGSRLLPCPGQALPIPWSGTASCQIGAQPRPVCLRAQPCICGPAREKIHLHPGGPSAPRLHPAQPSGEGAAGRCPASHPQEPSEGWASLRPRSGNCEKMLSGQGPPVK